nr:transposase [Gluconacetobacter sacchari]
MKAIRGDVTVTDLARRHEVQPKRIDAWKKQLQDQAARAFDGGAGFFSVDACGDVDEADASPTSPQGQHHQEDLMVA